MRPRPRFESHSDAECKGKGDIRVHNEDGDRLASPLLVLEERTVETGLTNNRAQRALSELPMEWNRDRPCGWTGVLHHDVASTSPYLLKAMLL